LKYKNFGEKKINIFDALTTALAFFQNQGQDKYPDLAENF
jgi:hypothetical protein